MPVSPDQLFDLAESLAHEDSEVQLRNSSSRAYYAAYHRCLSIGKHLGLQFEDSGVHRNLIDTFTRNSNMKLKGIGYLLEQCRRLRVKADYDIELEYGKKEAQSAIECSRKIMERANAYRPES